MKKWVKYFIYISMAFLIYSLWKADYLFIPTIDNYLILAVSVFFLIAGFLTKSFVWTQTLRHKGFPVSFKKGFVSVGISELGKYIPGKLWIILGRSGYISNEYAYKLTDTSYVSFYTQVITIWSGLLVGALGFIFIFIPIKWLITYISGFLIISVVIFIPSLQNLVLKLINKVFKRQFTIPIIKVDELFRLLPYYLFDWLIRIMGFGFLLLALSPQFFSFAYLPAYPLSITMGILVMIAPGGLGIREGVLVFWFQSGGLTLEESTTIALSTRLWMLIGELFIFVAAILIKRKKTTN